MNGHEKGNAPKPGLGVGNDVDLALSTPYANPR
jgi:hypothetical protein